MSKQVKLTDAQNRAFYQVYINRHDDAGYCPGLSDAVKVSTVESLRKHGLVTSHSINKYRVVLTPEGLALADEMYGGQWINNVFAAIDWLYQREQDSQRERERLATIYRKYPFIPSDATIQSRFSDDIAAVRLDWAEVVKHQTRGYVVRPTCEVMMSEEDAIEMSAQLLTAVSIAQQLNAALESERAIKEGA